jgi:hypothetical protein
MKTVLQILFLPFRLLFYVIFEVPNWFFGVRIPEMLPRVIKPLYRFGEFMFFSIVVYIVSWEFVSFVRMPEYIKTLDVFGYKMPYIESGLTVGFPILLIGFIEMFVSYWRMFWAWLASIKWGVKFHFYW